MSVAFASLGISLFKRENGYLLAYICPFGLPAHQAKHGSDFEITKRKEKWLLPSGVKLSPPLDNLLPQKRETLGRNPVC